MSGSRRADLQWERRSSARQCGIEIVSLAEVKALDADFDGADEVDARFNLLKGFGGALVREKIVAASSKKFIVLVGPEKLYPHLGARKRVPVEVVPFGVAFVTRVLGEAWDEGGATQERRRQRVHQRQR